MLHAFSFGDSPIVYSLALCERIMTSIHKAIFHLAIFTTLSSCSPAADKPLDKPVLDPVLLKTFVEELVEIKPGTDPYPTTFQMGSPTGPQSELPVHVVTMSGPFSIAKFEVPQNLYQAVMGHNPSRWQGPRNSAESMTSVEAREFCSRLTQALQDAKLIGADEVIRLPTEAEWEYCCRAGTTTAYSFGDAAQGTADVAPQASLLDKYAWHTGNAAGNDPAVGALAPNPWGLYDMHGYLWEYCEDKWHETYTDAPAASFPAWEGEGRLGVLRGGSWKDSYDHLRSSSRSKVAQIFRDDAVGFRCVKARTD